MNKNIDEKIEDLFLVLQTQKKEVEQAEKDIKRNWLTSCSLSLPSRNKDFNIQVENEKNLKSALVELLMIQEYSQKAEQILGLYPNNEYFGYIFDEWIADFKKQIAKINIKAKKEKLAILEKRLTGIFSPEKIREMELEAIDNSLNS